MNLVVGGLIALGNFLINLGTAVIDWGISLLGKMNEIVDTVKNVIKLVIIILGEILKAFLSIVLISLFLTFLPLADFVDMIDIDNKKNIIKIETPVNKIILYFDFIYRYESLFDIDLPNVNIILTKNNDKAPSPLSVWYKCVP